KPVHNRLAVFFVDCPREWDAHRTCLDAILSVSAVGDAVFTHQAVKSFIAIHFAGGMHVEKTNLSDRLRPDVLIIVVLRACLKTTAAGHTARIGVALLHFVLIHSRPWPQVVSAIQLDPCVHLFQVIKHPRTIYYYIEDCWKLCHT